MTRMTGDLAGGAKPFSVCGQMTALPGRRAELIDLVAQAASACGTDGGSLSYTINVPLDDPDMLWVTELWTDEDAHDVTTKSESVAAVSKRCVGLLSDHTPGLRGHAVYVREVAGAPDQRQSHR